MTDEVSSEVIKKTQNTLGKYVKKPPLTDKLLKKPPFRFLHDVVHSVIRDTGFLKGLFTEEELVSDNVKEKEAKIAFLNKLIEAVKTLSQTNLPVRASKIIAGLEPRNTNLLLQAIAKAIDSNADSSKYISLRKSDKTINHSKKSQIPKAEKSRSVKAQNKDEKDSKGSRGSKKTTNETPKLKLDTPKVGKSKSSARKEEEVKHKTGRRGREDKKDIKENKVEKKSPKIEDSPKTDESPKTDSAEKETNRTDLIRRNSYTIDRKEKHISPNETTKNDSHKDIEEGLTIDNQKEPLNDESSNNIASNNQNGGMEKVDVEDSNKNLVRPKSARPKSGEIKSNSAVKDEKVKQEMKPLELDLKPPKPLVPPSRPKSSLRPPSVRPSSARPGAPRLRADSALPMHEPINMGSINVIVENMDTTAADEEETVIIETAPVEPEEVTADLPVELDNKGHLVEQILEQLEVDGGGKKRTEIDWEPDVAARNKEGAAKEVSQLVGLVQNLTKTANPLGKLINYLHEDIEAMHSELQMWVNTKRQLYTEIRKQKRSSVESNKPLLTNLEVLNQDIKKMQQEITQINSNILRNDTRIKELLNK